MANQSDFIIKINIVNYSTWPAERIMACLDNLSRYLNVEKINISFDYIFDDAVIKAITESLLDKDSLKTIDAILTFLCDFQYKYPRNRVLILGESLNTVNPYGDALDPIVSVIRELDEKVIWHEAAHLLGAMDHYDIESTIKYQPELGYISRMPIPECTDKSKCLMQWDAKQGGIICSKGLNEIANYLIDENTNSMNKI